MNAAQQLPQTTNDAALERVRLSLRNAIATQVTAINECEAAYRRGDILAVYKWRTIRERAEIAENEAYRDYFTISESARRTT